MQQELTFSLEGNMKVDAHVRDFTVRTDQKVDSDGDNTGPTPLELFFASLGTCASVNIAYFCIERKIPYKDIQMKMTIERDDRSHAVKKINMEIALPADFPEKYRNALLKAIDACAVKKTIKAQPDIITTLSGACKT